MTPGTGTVNLKPGSRWRSAVCDTEVVVVRAPAGPVSLQIGGAWALPAATGKPATAQPDASFADGTLLGKRYADEGTGLEVLCTKAGTGTITVDGRRVTVMTPRPLPASD